MLAEYPVDTVFHSLYLRQRDLTPTKMDRGPYNMPVEGIAKITAGKKWGAAEFLAFIQDELKPFINSTYNTVPEESGYFGHSLGGLFGLYCEIQKCPGIFNSGLERRCRLAEISGF